MTGELQLEPSGDRNPSDSDPLLDNHHGHTASSSEIIKNDDADADVEAGSVACCRICLECDGEDGEFLFLFINSD